MLLRPLGAAEPALPELGRPTISPGQTRLDFTPYPATVQYRLQSAPEVGGPYMDEPAATFAGFSSVVPSWDNVRFYRLEAVPMSPADLLTATVLNRLAYGPTPGELARVRSVGPEAYLAEQLVPETIAEDLPVDRVEPLDTWRQVVVTGLATSSTLYLYLEAAGEAYVDDVRLVAGTNAAAGPNLLVNGDFELPLTTGWLVGSNFLGSAVVTDRVHGGAGSLHVVASGAGSSVSNSLWQVVAPALTNNQTCTLSYWYYAPSQRGTDLLIRLSLASSGRGQIYSDADATVPARTLMESGQASLADLRNWQVQHAVQSPRQLVEVLAQFLENHFVTQQSKTRDYLGQYYNSTVETDRRATRMEWVENRRWREALLNPQCTFHDFLTISAESPAMIIYLDTVTSRGDGNRVANENYARELFELFCQGVDNGYDQSDIVEMSRVWTGWGVRLMDATNEFNPMAPQSTTLLPGATNPAAISGLVGVWGFGYRTNTHSVSNKVLFAGKMVPSRFGSTYTGRLYGTNAVPGLYEYRIPGRTGAAGMAEGYEALAYLADLPFTQEFISVKLCHLLVHDDFVHGVYDYTAANPTAEVALVRDCMAAWDSHQPRGQLRKVVETILQSELFRTHGAAAQKAKTPLEFAVSAVRALRAPLPDGSFTATLDGASLPAAFDRMGGMKLFDRGDPDGYPESASPWISAGTLAERLRYVQSYCLAPGANGRGDSGASACAPVTLLKQTLPAASWKDAGAVVDFFLGLVLPGEGRANLDLYRTELIRYLNTADDGMTASGFSGLADTSAAYDTRVRGMVAMLLSSPRFQEQ